MALSPLTDVEVRWSIDYGDRRGPERRTPLLCLGVRVALVGALAYLAVRFDGDWWLATLIVMICFAGMALGAWADGQRGRRGVTADELLERLETID